MYILINEKNHKNYNSIGWVTMSENGFLTVSLRPCETETFVHISNVTELGDNIFGENDSSDHTEEYDSERTYEGDYPFGNENHVDENGMPFGYHEYYDSDDNPIRNYDSKTSESESS